MSGRKTGLITAGWVLAVSLLVSALTAVMVSRCCSWSSFDLLNTICQAIVEQEPGTKKVVAAVLKEYVSGGTDRTAPLNFLSSLGYRINDFSPAPHRQIQLLAAAGFLAGLSLFLATFLCRNRAEAKRIRALADYLEQVNTGKAAILCTSGEDEFAKLEDEIYKTVTVLYQTRDAAVRAKNDFAENLANIAHQIKTPITAISLAVQTMQREGDREKTGQIQRQLLRLARLEEALLVLARLDAGTLCFQKAETDVFTLLALAADHLQELFAESGTAIELPELGEAAVCVDLDWTMEAVVNLMKNCMEHGAGGTVHCTYAQNPLYTEIEIWDEGEGFCEEDLPHLFERFYRGKRSAKSGIGIGLSLAREIIERQNGTIRAKNRPDGGACFEVRFYSH